ncbi:YciI family protein [Amphibiibacter pelophylacis]|uniref:YciI family protein n=1 Tax=Amphibiibacter pelophylacis TaxID=1799477 RepID=A0ACC6P1Y1_9BURK
MSPQSLFVIVFTDRPGQGALRAQHLTAHIAWLEDQRKIVPVGGSLRRELGETPVGGLWLARADSKETLDALIRTDPFYLAGLRQGWEIFHWSKANAERLELI